MKATCSFVLLSLVSLLGFEAVVGNPTELFVCEAEGRFADPFDCTSYIDCITDEEGSFTIQSGSCKSNAFDPIYGGCVKASSVPDCNPREAKSFIPSQEFDHLCKGNDSFACGNCKTLVTCIDGDAYEETCQPNTLCEGSEIFDGGVCIAKSDATCKCSEPNTFFADPYSDSTFYQCQNANEDIELYDCPIGMVFDKTQSVCINSNGLPPCYKMGVFANTENCTVYYSCIQTSKGWMQKSAFCPNATIYNEDSGNCEDPCTYVHKPFSCEKEGRFPHPTVCNNYFECISSGNNTFTQVERSCPSNLYWSGEKKFCIKDKPDTCADKPKPKCPINELAC